MKFSKKSGRVSKILRRDLEFWKRVLWNFKLWKLTPLFLRGTSVNRSTVQKRFQCILFCVESDFKRSGGGHERSLSSHGRPSSAQKRPRVAKERPQERPGAILERPDASMTRPWPLTCVDGRALVAMENPGPARSRID